MGDVVRGPEMAPKPPNVRSAAAAPGRFSGVGDVVRGPPVAPSLPTFAAPRRRRGASREWVTSCGAPRWPSSLPMFAAPPAAPGRFSEMGDVVRTPEPARSSLEVGGGFQVGEDCAGGEGGIRRGGDRSADHEIVGAGGDGGGRRRGAHLIVAARGPGS